MVTPLGPWTMRPQELVTNFFHEKVGVCICKHRHISIGRYHNLFKSKYRPTFSILRVCDKFLCMRLISNGVHKIEC